MLIQCTKKLLDKLKINPQKLCSTAPTEPLFSWYANIVTVDRKNIVVLLNNATRYAIVLYGVKAKDFKSFDDIIATALAESLCHEAIFPDIAERYLQHTPQIVYSKTSNRRMIGVMNSICRDLPFYLSRGRADDGIFQPEISAHISDRPFINTFGEGNRPIERLYAALGEFAGRRAFDNRAVQIKVTLDLYDTYEVWRRLVVPIRISFSRLHDVIQSAFHWLGYHLHDFYIFDDMENPVLKLVDGQGAFEYPDIIERVADNRVLLNEIIPTHKKIKYDYDFGDNWQHYIEVERIIDDYDKNYAECIDGVGNTPPEDVGGVSGYQDFREIIADPQHEEYESTLRWAKSLNYMDFDIDRVRRIYC